jgi:signal transduction histidine kinase
VQKPDTIRVRDLAIAFLLRSGGSLRAQVEIESDKGVPKISITLDPETAVEAGRAHDLCEWLAALRGAAQARALAERYGIEPSRLEAFVDGIIQDSEDLEAAVAQFISRNGGAE